MTWSIVARDPHGDAWGVAVASRFFAVGALCPHVRPGAGALSTQALINPTYGPRGLDLLAGGASAADVIRILVAGDAGANCDVLAGSGSTSTGTSAHEIDRSTVTTSTAQLRLLRLVPRENNAHGDYAKWELLINEHVYKSTSGV